MSVGKGGGVSPEQQLGSPIAFLHTGVGVVQWGFGQPNQLPARALVAPTFPT